MRIDIRTRSLVLTETLNHHVRRRIQYALGRFAQRLASIKVLLENLKGPQKGVYKRCKVFVKIRPSFNVIIEVTDPKLEIAVNRALERTNRTVARRLDQIMDRRKC